MALACTADTCRRFNPRTQGIPVLPSSATVSRCSSASGASAGATGHWAVASARAGGPSGGGGDGIRDPSCKTKEQKNLNFLWRVCKAQRDPGAADKKLTFILSFSGFGFFFFFGFWTWVWAWVWNWAWAWARAGAYVIQSMNYFWKSLFDCVHFCIEINSIRF